MTNFHRPTWTYRLAFHGSLWAFNHSVFSLVTNGALFYFASQETRLGLSALPLHWRIPLTIVLFDLCGYFFHRVLHSVPALWEVHKVHHSDEQMDSTTALRSHLFQVFLTGGFDIALLVLLRPGLFAYLCYWALLQSSLFFHHSATHEGWREKVCFLFVTPDLHRAHHEKRPREALGNFANIFSFWDWAFATKKRPSKDVTLGLHDSVFAPYSLRAVLWPRGTA